MKTTTLIAARMGSSRFRGKNLTALCGKPMLQQLVERSRRSKYVENIVVATSDQPEDDEIEAFTEKFGIGCFRGSVNDVLGRLTGAVQANPADLVLELLGDNPLIHSDLINAVVEHYLSNDTDYAVNVTTEYPHAPDDMAKFPVGIRVQAFPPWVLEKCEELAKTPAYREHATNYIADHPEIFRLSYLEATGPWANLCRPDLTFAVNFRENLELCERILEACGGMAAETDLISVIKAFDDDESLKQLMGTQKR